MQLSDSIVIIPTYNERENIENIIRAVFGLDKVFHILVIEDGSPDGTASIVKTLQQEFSERLFMIERKGKLGLGTAYIAGFKWALEHAYEYIFEMDADFSHNPNDLALFVRSLCKRRRRRICRLPLCKWCECSQLADGTGADVLFCLQVRPLHYRYSGA